MAARPTEEAARTVGRYVLFGEIAAGGMATVHFGRLSGPVGFSRTVAIKRLHPQFAKDPEFVTMFLDEARLAGRIRHPNVVPTLDVVATEGEIFIVMEYVQGESLSRLSRVLRDRKVLIPPNMVVSMMAAVLHGLHAAHEATDEQGQPLNIVHRDVSPQNVLIGTDGSTRVLDFGVAKAAGRLQTTREGQIKGKIAYMAPEQLHGGAVTRLTDVYAAGIVLWEALTGRRLYEGDNEAMVLVKALEGRVDPPSRLVQGLPPSFDTVIARAITRDPSARFATAREMALALERCLPMASPSEVGEWVENAAGAELTKRARRVAEIESVSSVNSMPGLAADLVEEIRNSLPRERTRSSPSVDDSWAPSVDVEPPTLPPRPNASSPSLPRLEVASQVSSISVSRTPAQQSRAPVAGSKAPLIIASSVALFFFLIIAVGGVIALRGRSPSPPVSAALPQEKPLEKALEAPSPSAPPKAEDPIVMAVPPPPVVPSASAVPDVTPTPPSPKAKPRVAPATAPVAVAKACDPPFTLDALGHKKYKLECLKP